MALINKFFHDKTEKSASVADILEPTQASISDGSKSEQSREMIAPKEGELGKEKTTSLSEAETAVAEKDAVSLTSPVSLGSAAPAVQPSVKSIARQKIENILEENLEDVYFHLDAAHQRLLKEEGDRAARQIETILLAGKSVAVKILAIIKKWLQFIPGINKFFLEQEAKIKTDKIIRLNENVSKK
ncbi:hypothetical protein A3H03_02025 [Candidatus Kuenenbacteria bacterium RIFCSPLOWO2_12_FULL_42_13]|uniref:Uncharacterized protein n=2 Tax=Candidatus Kueneniibacteriota TaxID=1752740 RepID=A0A1F6G0V5_9BACT|nr:MAG: hypothetical protein A3H55_00925 [Candidatus Kuenenbacteria bacterium RIFCSPLOWO2_02_FULL_42_16]OGG91751.1 MAG: hypothetical protein A3H03_02025 [Candidatus Kuenenbacteria bacterium RIFCSPLOWO2_12_FULL_42_13]